MKTAVTQTSLLSYFDDIKDGKEITQGEKVLKAMNELGGKATINQLYRKTGILPSTVSARLNKLLKNKELYKNGETIIDSVSKKKNELWFVKNPTQQPSNIN